MHWERDILHTKVIPEVNTLAREYGEAVEICDLRWGINTSELPEQDATETGSSQHWSICRTASVSGNR